MRKQNNTYEFFWLVQFSPGSVRDRKVFLLPGQAIQYIKRANPINMSQAHIRRHQLLTGAALLVLCCCLVAYFANTYAKLEEYETAKELLRRGMLTATVLEMLPLKDVHTALGVYHRVATTSTTVSWGPSQSPSPTVSSLSRLVTVRVPSDALFGSITVSETRSAWSDVSVRSPFAAIGLSLTVTCICFVFFFSQMGNIVVLRTGRRTLGALSHCFGLLVSIGFMMLR